MQTQIPEDRSNLDVEALEGLRDELLAEFDELLDRNAPVAELTEVADAVDMIKSEIDSLKAEIEADEQARKDLSDRIKGQGGEPEPEASGETGPAPEQPVVEPAPVGGEKEPETVSASADKPKGAPSAAAMSNTATPPEAPPSKSASQITITAAADVPGFSSGAAIEDSRGIAVAMHARARGLTDGSPRLGVATVHRNLPEHLIVDKPSEGYDVMEAAVKEHLAGQDAESLLASGGWCTPSENLFDQFSVESRDGLLDLPTLGIARGGINVPSYFGISDAQGALWSWNEDIDGAVSLTITDYDVATGVGTATTSAAHNLLVGSTVKFINMSVAGDNGTYTVATVPTATTFTVATGEADHVNATGQATIVKGSLKVPCPTWTDVRLEAEGLTLTHGNLMDRAYPEMTRRFVDLTVTAHLHRLSNAVLADILAGATAQTVTTQSDAIGDAFNALDLAVADYRSEHLASENVILEAAVPMHVTNLLRSAYGMRAGLDPRGVTLGQIASEFTARNVRPQFLAGYQPLWSGSVATGWPATQDLSLWFSGAYVMGTAGSIDLGVVRDSTQNETNDFTLAWSEEFYCTVQRGPAARTVTFTSTVNGQTGGPIHLGT